MTDSWKEGLRLVDEGGPRPPRRVERSVEDWRRELTPEQFREDMTSAAAEKAVKKDFQEGQSIGVTGTPAFLGSHPVRRHRRPAG